MALASIPNVHIKTRLVYQNFGWVSEKSIYAQFVQPRNSELEWGQPQVLSVSSSLVHEMNKSFATSPHKMREIGSCEVMQLTTVSIVKKTNNASFCDF